jgi:hypothetical protein
MHLGFHSTPRLNARYNIIDIDCSVNKVMGYVRGLPSGVGVRAGESEASKLGFGASVSSSTTCAGSSGKPWSCPKTSS